MTARELLELAAKAAGYEMLPAGASKPRIALLPDDPVYAPWSPLSSDGDALRLAMKLGIQIIPGENYVEAVKPSPRLRQTRFCEMYSAHDNPLAATRYAVVRAAAEIGRPVL